jgi:hypothetical protein
MNDLFDPDKFLAETVPSPEQPTPESDTFDPDTFLAETSEPPKTAPIKSVGNYLAKPFVETGKFIGESAQKIGENVAAPTEIGDKYGLKPGSTAELYAGIPERSLRLGEGVGGAAMTGAGEALSPIVGSTMQVGKWIGKGVDAALPGTPVRDTYNEMKGDFSQAAKDIPAYSVPIVKKGLRSVAHGIENVVNPIQSAMGIEPINVEHDIRQDLSPIINPISARLKGSQEYENYKATLTPAQRANLEASEQGANTALGLIPFGPLEKPLATVGKEALAGGKELLGAAKNVAGGTAGFIGSGIEKLGQRALSGELKIKQSLAKSGYGRNIEEKKKNIVKTIQDYKLISPVGNFDKSIQSANEKIGALQSSRESQLDAISTGPDAPQVVPTDILSKTRNIAVPENIISEPEVVAEESTKPAKKTRTVALGQFDKANGIIDGIIADAQKAGLDKPTTLNNLARILKTLDPDGRLFNKGAFISKDDALDDIIRKDMYFNILDEIEKVAPQVRTLGREEKRLIDARGILIDAQSRIANREVNSFKDWASTLSAGGIAHFAGAPTPETIAAAITVYALKKAGKQGRFAATALRTGEALKSLSGKGKPPEPPTAPGGAPIPKSVVPDTPELTAWKSESGKLVTPPAPYREPPENKKRPPRNGLDSEDGYIALPGGNPPEPPMGPGGGTPIQTRPAPGGGPAAAIPQADVELNRSLLQRLKAEATDKARQNELNYMEQLTEKIKKLENDLGNGYIWTEGLPIEEATYVKRGSPEETWYQSRLAAIRDEEAASRPAQPANEAFQKSRDVPRAPEQPASEPRPAAVPEQPSVATGGGGSQPAEPGIAGAGTVRSPAGPKDASEAWRGRVLSKTKDLEEDPDWNNEFFKYELRREYNRKFHGNLKGRVGVTGRTTEQPSEQAYAWLTDKAERLSREDNADLRERLGLSDQIHPDDVRMLISDAQNTEDDLLNFAESIRKKPEEPQPERQPGEEPFDPTAGDTPMFSRKAEPRMDLETAKETARSNGLEYVTSTPASGGPFYTFRDPRSGTEFKATTRSEVRQAIGDLADHVAPKGTVKAGEKVAFSRKSPTPEQVAKASGLEYKGTWQTGHHEFFDPQTQGNLTDKDLTKIPEKTAKMREAFKNTTPKEEPVTHKRLVNEIAQYRGTGAISSESVKGHGKETTGRFRSAAFRDSETGKIYETGPMHLTEKLPKDVIIGEEDGMPIGKASLESGFVDKDGKFYNREEAAQSVKSVKNTQPKEPANGKEKRLQGEVAFSRKAGEFENLRSSIKEKETALDDFIKETKNKALKEKGIDVIKTTTDDFKKYEIVGVQNNPPLGDKNNEHQMEFFDRKRNELENKKITDGDIDFFISKFENDWGIRLKREKAIEIMEEYNTNDQLEKWVGWSREHPVFKNGNDLLVSVYPYNTNPKDPFALANEFYLIPENLINRKSIPETSWNIFNSLNDIKSETSNYERLAGKKIKEDYGKLEEIRAKNISERNFKSGWKPIIADVYQNTEHTFSTINKKEAEKRFGDNFVVLKNVPIILNPNGGIYDIAQSVAPPYAARKISLDDFVKEVKSNMSDSQAEKILEPTPETPQFSRKPPVDADQFNLFGGSKTLSELEAEEAKRLEKGEVSRRQDERKGGEADMRDLPMFENADIEGSQQTLAFSRKGPDVEQLKKTLKDVEDEFEELREARDKGTFSVEAFDKEWKSVEKRASSIRKKLFDLTGDPYGISKESKLRKKKAAEKKESASKSVLDQISVADEEYGTEIVDYPARGFLLPDGNYLSIGSGTDHRSINGMVDLGKKLEDKYESERTDKMLHIMRQSGAIRFIPESKSFHLETDPTQDQTRAISSYIRDNGSAEVEFPNGKSNTYTEDNLFEFEEDIERGNIALSRKPEKEPALNERTRTPLNLPEKQFRPAKSSDQRAAQALAKSAGKMFGRDLTPDDIQAVEPFDPEARNAAAALRKITPYQVVFVKTSDAMKAAGIDFNGVLFGGRIFLNVDGEHPYLITGLHETLEGMNKNHADLMKPLLQHIKENLTPEGRKKAELRAIHETGNKTPTEAEIENAIKENAFDFGSDQMSRPEWWTSLYEKSPQAVQKLIQGLIAHINKFLADLKIRKLDNSQHYRDAADIRDRMKAVHAEVLKREFGEEGAGKIAGDMAEFARKAGKSDVSKQTTTKEFKKWFGDWENDPENASKVVDADGKPLVVYKGMPVDDYKTGQRINVINRDSEFPAFNSGEKGTKISGFFSSDPKVASRFAMTYSKGGEGNAVFPTYLSFKKPFTIDAKGNFAGNIEFGKSGQEFRDAIRSEKYDGIIIKNTKDEGDVYVAFSPTQIKSATGNRGTFDPENPDIRFSRKTAK